MCKETSGNSTREFLCFEHFAILLVDELELPSGRVVQLSDKTDIK
jgi:hypothetical protein